MKSTIYEFNCGSWAKEYSANYKQLLDIIEEMTILNMKLLKEDACL